MQALPSLIALLAVATPAYAQKGDISVETDLGERYIIKMSAVYVIDKITQKRLVELQYAPRLKALSDGANRIKQNMKQTDSDYNKCLMSDAFSKKHCDYNKNSVKYVQAEQQRLEYVEANIAKLKEKIKAESGSRTTAIEAVLIKYRPIFVDLNDQKKGLEYKLIKCIRPSVTRQGIDTLVKNFPGYITVGTSDLALQAAERKLCERVAGF